MAGLRTGELARLAGVNIQTLRFYERRGLLPVPPRRPSGYREYPAHTVAVVQFIKRAQDLGFSLREIKELLDLREVPRARCADVAALARRKIAEIEGKIRDLRAMRTALTRLLHECPGSAPIACCPIIESLEGSRKSQSSRRSKKCGRCS